MGTPGLFIFVGHKKREGKLCFFFLFFAKGNKSFTFKKEKRHSEVK
jgi:hypothetical protein